MRTRTYLTSTSHIRTWTASFFIRSPQPCWNSPNSANKCAARYCRCVQRRCETHIHWHTYSNPHFAKSVGRLRSIFKTLCPARPSPSKSKTPNGSTTTLSNRFDKLSTLPTEKTVFCTGDFETHEPDDCKWLFGVLLLKRHVPRASCPSDVSQVSNFSSSTIITDSDIS